jgi:two-component system, chemotaxis family, chemotaxis protein CheY
MALDLERLSVLVVEDSPFIRSLLANALKVLGVGQVSLADHGGAAIELLSLVKADPIRAGVQTIDLVLTNWDMSPVDGEMLVRWLRRHKDSTDRFMPVMMITAYTDRVRVQQARDLGVNEILTKPFTIKGLGDKLVSVINRNRQFVHTKDYFGPDRRRQAQPYDGSERRLLTDKSPEVEVVNVS